MIHILRGEKVILDAEIAALYGVETRAVVQAVKKPQPISQRLPLPADRGGGPTFEITNCDLKMPPESGGKAIGFE